MAGLILGSKEVSIDYGYQASLTDAIALTIDTALTTVQSVVACIDSFSGTTPPSRLEVTKGASPNQIKITAVGAVGTTKVNWIAVGVK